MKKLYVFLTLLFLLCSYRSFAQDIIIKNDKTEIKAKVIELTDIDIKYKKFEFLDGPTYNISKAEVFMIIYKNGQRETITQPSRPVSTNTVYTSPTQASQAIQKVNSDSSVVDYSGGRLVVMSSSSSINDGFGSVSSTGIIVDLNGETRLIKNFVNFGYGLSLTHASASGFGEDASSTSFGTLGYLSLYLPINKVTGNIANRNTGFFPFTRATIRAYYVDDSTSTSFSFEAGVDYKFSSTFGLTLITSKFNAFGGGITFKF